MRWAGVAIGSGVRRSARGQQLAGLTLISLGDETGREHVVLARDGKLYAAVASGNILRMNPNGSGQEVFVNTGGRVLGFDFDASGRTALAAKRRRQ